MTSWRSERCRRERKAGTAAIYKGEGAREEGKPWRGRKDNGGTKWGSREIAREKEGEKVRVESREGTEEKWRKEMEGGKGNKEVRKTYERKGWQEGKR